MVSSAKDVSPRARISGLVAFKSVLHAECRNFDPGQACSILWPLKYNAHVRFSGDLQRSSSHRCSSVSSIVSTPGQDRTGDLQRVKLTS